MVSGMPKLKVLWFTNTQALYNPITRFKGTGNWIANLQNVVSRSENIVLAVAFFDHINSLEKVIVDNTTYYRIPTHLTSKLKKLKYNWSLKIDYKFQEKYYNEIISDFNPDIIQIFGIESPFIDLVTVTKIPVIFHLQGLLKPYSYFFYPNVRFYQLLLKKNLIEILKGNNNYFNKLRLMKMLKREECFYKNISYVLGRTAWDFYCTKVLFQQAKYFHCDEIMRTEFYLSKWSKERAGQIVLYTTVRESPYKGIDFLFNVHNILSKYRPDIDFIWRVAGISEDDFSSKIFLRGNIKFNQKLFLLGYLDTKNIVKEMLKADIFIYPSRIENGCNAVQEAMLIGMPIVSTFAGGLSTTIENGVTGLLVQVDDPIHMAGAIIELVQDAQKAKKLGLNAREKAIQRHNPERIAQNLIDIYKRIITS